MNGNIMLKIVMRAVKSRVKAGEELEDVLDSYPRLTRSERKEIIEELGQGGD